MSWPQELQRTWRGGVCDSTLLGLRLRDVLDDDVRARGMPVDGEAGVELLEGSTARARRNLEPKLQQLFARFVEC